MSHAPGSPAGPGGEVSEVRHGFGAGRDVAASSRWSCRPHADFLLARLRARPQSGGKIPNRFTCFGDNRSPPLVFRDVLAGAQSLTLMMNQLHPPRDVLTLSALFNTRWAGTSLTRVTAC